MQKTVFGSPLLAALLLVATGAWAQTPVKGQVTNVDAKASTFTIQEPAPSNRVTTYSVNKTFKGTANGAPMRGPGDMHVGDKCAVTVATPPFADTATCTR